MNQATNATTLPAPAQSGVGASQIFSALQNIVTQISALASDYTNLNGPIAAYGISSATIAKNTGGTLVSMSVINAGSAAGFIYNATTLTDTSKPIVIIPMVVGIHLINMPAGLGIVVAPGTGQVVTVSFS